ncbi:MAG: dihydrofolate reductase [Bacteroidales bacterium]|nr:dihydrofolate reductase [Bacteroidales bacterium]
MHPYPPSPNISIIVAVASNWAIGKDNNLLWHISDDLKHFKQLTSGHPVIMGRRTFLSLPRRPLPNRHNIVLSHNPDFSYDDISVVHSVGQAVNLVRSESESFVIGGAEIYKAFLPLATTLYVTHVLSHFDADTFFPPIDTSLFREISRTPTMHDAASNLDYYYADYSRIAPACFRCR